MCYPDTSSLSSMPSDSVGVGSRYDHRHMLSKDGGLGQRFGDLSSLYWTGTILTLHAQQSLIP